MSRALSVQQWYCPHSFMVHDTTTCFLPEIHWRAIYACWESHYSSRGRCFTHSHPSCRKVVLGHFQPLHMKKCFPLCGTAHWPTILTTGKQFSCQCSLKSHPKTHTFPSTSSFLTNHRTGIQLLPPSSLPLLMGL